MKTMVRSRTLILFLIGLVIKIAFLAYAGSTYLTDLFIPFLDSAVLNFGHNPWVHLHPKHFPYGTILFSLLFVPRFIAYKLLGTSVLGTSSLGIALIKLPLLLIDVAFYQLLRRITPSRNSAILYFFWLNPVLFYITYIHGQLDIVSTFFCFLSLWFLTKDQITRSSLAMVASVLSKFHVIAVIPFMMVYIWNRYFARDAIHKILRWMIIWVPLTLLGFLPLIAAGTFSYVTAGSPEALRLLAAKINYGDNQALYLGILLALGMLGRLCFSTSISDRGLYFGVASIFGTLLLATNPAPGWYYWVFPFFSLFFATYLNVPKSLFWGHQLLYILYFSSSWRFFPLSENSPLYPILFTLLQTSLAGILVAIWKYSLTHEAPTSRRTRPITIGLAGDSGAGKNHFSSLFVDILNPGQTLLIEGDDYHLWERGHEMWETFTHLHPKANHLAVLADHTSQLSKGMSVQKAHYDHQTGKFTDPMELRPSKAVLIQGLHSFYFRGMGDRFDLKIFLSPDPLIRLAWKVQRDGKDRGHSPEAVLNSLNKRSEDSKSFIEPQRALADWIIEFHPIETVTEKDILKGKIPEIYLKHIVNNEAIVDRLLKALELFQTLEVLSAPFPGDLHRVTIEYRGQLKENEVETAALAIFPNLRQITRGRRPPIWRHGYDGINQLMAIALIENVSQAEGL